MNVWPLLCSLHGTPLFMYFQATTERWMSARKMRESHQAVTFASLLFRRSMTWRACRSQLHDRNSPAKSRKAGTPEHVDKRVSRVALRLKSKIGNQTKLAACNWTTLGLVYTLIVSIDRVNTLQPRRFRINTEKIFCISLGFTFGVIIESRVFSRLLGVHGRQHTFSLKPSLIYSRKKYYECVDSRVHSNRLFTIIYRGLEDCEIFGVYF